MERTARALVTISAVLFTVTLIVTLLNLVLRSDLLVQWATVYFIAWPIAAGTGFFGMPAARRIIVLMERKT
jgi:hypothetical protein